MLASITGSYGGRQRVGESQEQKAPLQLEESHSSLSKTTGGEKPGGYIRGAQNPNISWLSIGNGEQRGPLPVVRKLESPRGGGGGYL